jgi:hypothetical protein
MCGPFETATHGLAGDNRGRRNGSLKPGMKNMPDANAIQRVGLELLAITLHDAGHEEVQITAQ